MTESSNSEHPFELTNEIWYKNAQNDKNWMILDTLENNIFGNANLLLAHVIPIQNLTNDEKIGFAGTNILLSTCSNFLQQNAPSPNSHLYIVETNSNFMIAGSLNNEKFFSIDEKKITRLKLSESQNSVVSDIGKHIENLNPNVPIETFRSSGYFVHSKRFHPFDGIDWNIIGMIYPDDFLNSIITLKIVIACVSSGLILLVIAEGICCAFIIMRPIDNMGKLPPIGKDEFTPLSTPKESVFREVAALERSVGKLKLITSGFKKYVPPKIVDNLMYEEMKNQLSPFVKHQKISTLFTDIKDFTAITELVTPKMLMHMLTIYMENVTDIIIKKKGTLDKYIGDSVMAFWNAPEPVDDFVYLSCLAAQEITQNEEQLCKRLKAFGYPELHTRAGVHFGDALVGNMGSHHRLNYTALGDNVNLASRLESLNRVYGTSLLVSDTCYEEIVGRLPCRLVDFVSVKGKTEGIKIYEIMSNSESDVKYAYEFTIIMNEYYFKKDFKKAEIKFMQLQNERPNDKVCEIMIKRCREYITNPPPSDWNGLYQLQVK